MDTEPDESRPLTLDRGRAIHAFDLGILAGLAVAVVYGVLTDPFGLSFGLIAVGFIGGMLIGAAVARGAWNKQPHVADRRLQLLAAVIAGGAWFVGIAVAYFMSQALYQEATTGLLERLSFGGLSEYFAGLYQINALGHAGGLAAMAFMAWRGAR